jgi:hypothetical protein
MAMKVQVSMPSRAFLFIPPVLGALVAVVAVGLVSMP